ncbi:MAG: hypothetical protein V4539_01005 [Bacteroidota bacterium]
MKKKSHCFKYRKSFKIIAWGCQFDSLTEFKYALSINEDHVFLRERIHIRYNPGTIQPTDKLVHHFLSYVPDFLIRHKETGEAFLVEIKPRAFESEPQLALRKELAERYIAWKGYDWKYKVVFDDEIILSEQQLQDFEECHKLKSRSAFKIWFDQLNRKYAPGTRSLFKTAPDNKQIEFAMFGKLRSGVNWHRELISH